MGGESSIVDNDIIMLVARMGQAVGIVTARKRKDLPQTHIPVIIITLKLGKESSSVFVLCLTGHSEKESLHLPNIPGHSCTNFSSWYMLWQMQLCGQATRKNNRSSIFIEARTRSHGLNLQEGVFKAWYQALTRKCWNSNPSGPPSVFKLQLSPFFIASQKFQVCVLLTWFQANGHVA